MKDNEIIETWQKIQDILKRTENVVLQKDAIDDLVRHITNILDLINRQKADYDRLRKAYFRNQEIFAEQSLENERLKAEIARLENAYKQCAWERDIFAEDMKEEIKKDCSYLMLDIKTIKAEAYKECVEKVKEEYEDLMEFGYADISVAGLFKTLDNLLKELVGEDNAKDND